MLTGGASPVVDQDFAFGTKDFYDYYPSIDLDSSDDLITSFTQSSGNEFPSAYVDGRLGDRSEQRSRHASALSGGSASYNSPNPESFNSNAFPWGDYSGAGIDPSDQTAIWVTAEYSASQPTPLATRIGGPGSPRRESLRLAHGDCDSDCHCHTDCNGHCHDYRHRTATDTGTTNRMR